MNGTLRSIGKVALLATGFAAVPVLDVIATGIYKTKRMWQDQPLSPTAHDGSKPTAVVIASNRSTEITDFIPPYALLQASDRSDAGLKTRLLTLSLVSDHLLLDPFQELVGVRIESGVDEIGVAAALEAVGSGLDRSTVTTQPISSACSQTEDAGTGRSLRTA